MEPESPQNLLDAVCSKHENLAEQLRSANSNLEQSLQAQLLRRRWHRRVESIISSPT